MGDNINIKLKYILKHLENAGYTPKIKKENDGISITDAIKNYPLLDIKNMKISKIFISVSEAPILFSWAGLELQVEDL